MEVDHRIEMQVATLGGEGIFDDAWNYELRDKRSNGDAGNKLKNTARRRWWRWWSRPA